MKTKPITLKVYCGETVSPDKCIYDSLHPANIVKSAKKIIKDFKTLKSLITVHTNSPDMVSALKYIGIKEKVDCEFFLNGKKFGGNIDPIFKDFNRSLDLINKWGQNEQ